MQCIKRSHEKVIILRTNNELDWRSPFIDNQVLFKSVQSSEKESCSFLSMNQHANNETYTLWTHIGAFITETGAKSSARSIITGWTKFLF